MLFWLGIGLYCHKTDWQQWEMVEATLGGDPHLIASRRRAEAAL
jgi:hypothetical protein